MEALITVAESPHGVLVMLLGLYVLAFGIYVALWWVHRDGKRGRAKLHERIDEHINECHEQALEDAEWKGGVNAALKALTK